MSARGTVGGVLASIAVLTVGWQLGTAGADPQTATGAADGVGSGSVASGSASTPSSSDGTYTGTSTSTPFGDVQVQVSVSGGAITDVTALKLTDHDGRSVQISNRAAPILRSEVLQSQSANVQTVSGATYTTAAYLTSLQSALDQAGI